MGNPPDDKPIPDELARHIGALVDADSKPKDPGTPTAAPAVVRPAATSQPDMDAIDRGWDEDDEEEDDEDADDDALGVNRDAREARKPRKSAEEKAAARKRKAERRAEKQKARAAATLQKQKRKQPKARPPEEKRPKRGVTKRRAASDDADERDDITVDEAPTTLARGWRTMAILVAVVVVLGGLVFYFSTRQ